MTLKEAFETDFLMGAAINTWQLNGDGVYKKAKDQLLKHFNSITFENQMKPETMISLKSQELADTSQVVIDEEFLGEMLQMAQDLGLKVRGHCLLWHNQTPKWFFCKDYDLSQEKASKEVMRSRLESYIRSILTFCKENYPGLVYAWDVCNEVIYDDGKARTQSPWYECYGDDSYVEDAFTFARKYAQEGVSLFINDYNEYQEPKHQGYYQKAKELYEKGLIDGVGMQSHYLLDEPEIKEVQRAMEHFDSIDPGKIQIQLTEIDVHNPVEPKEEREKFENKYRQLFEILIQERRENQVNITSVTFWGLGDKDSWLTYFRKENSRPLLFDENYEEKPLVEELMNMASLQQG